MYESFFGLNEKPFSLLPDPSFFFPSKIHREALTLVEYGLYSQSGFTVLTGEVGSGKTTLMRYLLKKLDDDLTIGLISNTHQSLGQIMDWVCAAFELNAPTGNKLDQHQAFVDFLLKQYAKGKKTLLIIDEAQNLGLERLEEIRLLSNINSDKDLVLQLLLLGQPQLRQQLRQPELEQFVQRVSASYHLGRLTSEESFHYIRHRLKIAGGSKDIFTTDACHAAFHYSKGIPRIINLICETALVFAYGAGERIVTGKAIDDFVKSDASHLLFAVEADERVPLNEKAIQAFIQAVGIQTEAPEPEPEPSPPVILVKPQPKLTFQSVSNQEHEIEIPPMGLTEENTDDRATETAKAPLDDRRSTKRTWTNEAIAVTAGLCLGFALVVWYLFKGYDEPIQHQDTTTLNQPETTRPDADRTPPDKPAPATPLVQLDEAAQTRPQETPERAEENLSAMPKTAPEPEPEPEQPAPVQNNSGASIPETEIAAVREAATTSMDEPQETRATEDKTTLNVASDTSMSKIANQISALGLSTQTIAPGHLRTNFAERLQFPAGSAELDEQARSLLQDFAAIARENANLDILVTAHTDSQGGRRINQSLSESRSAKVAALLIEAGLDADRIKHLGKGEDELLVDPALEATRGPWINRRIEIDLIEKQPPSPGSANEGSLLPEPLLPDQPPRKDIGQI